MKNWTETACDHVIDYLTEAGRPLTGREIGDLLEKEAGFAGHDWATWICHILGALVHQEKIICISPTAKTWDTYAWELNKDPKLSAKDMYLFGFAEDDGAYTHTILKDIQFPDLPNHMEFIETIWKAAEDSKEKTIFMRLRGFMGDQG